ncbi:amidohydrolase [Nevskia sp.]|uniref:amidohydrolase n=1 Tax=Nevskia sp. TaxID=1929292 RepID=UPI0025E2A511|nr:amidohydrolase [Nevskia sp.]
MNVLPKLSCLAIGLALSTAASAADAKLAKTADALVDGVMAEVITARRYLHEHPELSNREVDTSAYVAAKLQALGYAVQTGVARYGIVAVLKGGKPGPVVALRADMDGLPVAEEVALPFASKVKSTYDGKDVGVMHACGHDTHMAMLLGAAEVFAKMKASLPGTVKLIFQPAEEGRPAGEEGGAELMVKEGVLTQAPVPEVIFGLHVLTQYETGKLAFRAGGLMASTDNLNITVKGKQTHGAIPWNGIDPIVVSAQIINALQTVVSRQIDITQGAAIVTIGKIDGGVRNNIIPDEVRMKGTLRSLDPKWRLVLNDAVRRTIVKTAEASGATATVGIGDEYSYPVTYNDPALTERMRPTLARIAGAGNIIETTPQTVAEDFSFYQQKIPGLFVFVGVKKPGASGDEYAPNHSPRFKVDEAGLPLGVRTLVGLTLDYLTDKGSK